MSKYRPYITDDGSIGLFSGDYDDIFHSRYGALTEAYEKFILPINLEKYLNKAELNVLDICYGIGYNTKAFLNHLINEIIKTKGNVSIYSDNCARHKDRLSIETLVADKSTSSFSNSPNQNRISHDNERQEEINSYENTASKKLIK